MDHRADENRLLALARERLVAKENQDWSQGVTVAHECIDVRGSSVDYCWLSYFLHRLQRLQDALDAINRAIDLDVKNDSAIKFRMRIVQEKDRWDRYTDQQHSREEARIQAEMEERRLQHLERHQRSLREREAERDFVRRRAEKPGLLQTHEPESDDSYEGLHELAEQAAGLQQRPIADPAAGGTRHTNGYRASMGASNEYTGYDGYEEQDLKSNTYDPIDDN